MSYTITQTDQFEAWLDSLSDRKAQALIARRILRIESGLLGNIRSVGDGVSELKIDFGPGYRLYFTVRELVVIVLLCGGDKSTQKSDIRKAREIARDL